MAGESQTLTLRTVAGEEGRSVLA